MRPTGPMSRALYRLTGVPAPLEHRALVTALERRAEAPRPTAQVRLVEPKGGPCHGPLPLNPPLWRQP